MALSWVSDFEGAWPGRNVYGIDSLGSVPADSTFDTQQNNSNYNFHITTTGVVPQWGSSAGEFRLRPGDIIDTDRRYACLVDASTTGQGGPFRYIEPGEDLYLANWLMIPSDSYMNFQLLWQDHDVYDFYSLPLANNISPHAIVVRDGLSDSWAPRPPDGFLPPQDSTVWLAFRACIGQADPGWHVKHWALMPAVRGTYYKFIIRLYLTDSASGVIKVWVDSTTGTSPASFSETPIVDFTGATNKSTATKAGMHLYFPPGIYTGRVAPPSECHMLMGGIARAFTTFDEAKATFGATTGDVSAPSLTSAFVSGDTITLGYSEALDITSVPVVGDFAVTVSGTARSLSSVSVSGSQVILKLSSPVAQGNVVLLSYTAGTDREIQDSTGNVAADLSALGVENRTTSVRTRTIARVVGSRVSNPGGRIAGRGGGGI